MAADIQTKENNLATYIKAIPLITGIVIILGLTKQYLYFKYFDINIIPYLSLSELALISSDEILNIIILSLVYFLFISLRGETFKASSYIYGKLVASGKIKKKIILPENSETEDENENNKSHISFLPFLFALITCVLYIIILNTKKTDTKLTLGLVLVALLFMNFLLSNVTYLLNKISFEGTMSLILILGIALFICNSTLTDAEKVKNGKYIGTSINTKDSTYISTSTNFFIGRTSEYIFIKNIEANNITIIPENEIKSLVLNTNDITKKLDDRPNKAPNKP